MTEEFQAQFTVEAIEVRSKGKEHLPITQGERLAVIVSTDAKLPSGKYLVEKEDGTRESISNKSNCQCKYCPVASFAHSWICGCNNYEKGGL